MLRSLLFASILLQTCLSFAQWPYAPAAGHTATTAIHRDSSIIQDWCTFVSFEAGYLDVADKAQGNMAATGTLNVSGYADGSVLSLGDSGEVVLSFNQPIYNGIGPDFAVFENSFSDTFLELAKVFVSSDGVNYVEFPCHSNTPDHSGIGGFGTLDPTDLHNLAGKYRAQYGTPFDLEDLIDSSCINLNHISHVKLIDCVGTSDINYASKDSYGNKIIDPYPTNFQGGGFDLDAIAAINISPLASVSEIDLVLNCYPNPASDQIIVQSSLPINYQLYSLDGQLMISGAAMSGHHTVNLSEISSGIYVLKTYTKDGQSKSTKISVYH